VPREWIEGTGFEASPADRAEPYLVYQSRDYQHLLVMPTGSEQVWVLNLIDRKVYDVPRNRVVITGRGAEVTSAPAEEIGLFEKTGADIVFAAGGETVRIYPAAPLTGEIELSTLLAKKPEYLEAAGEYRPDPGALARIREAGPLRVVVFFGTWCSSCSRHLPTLIQTLEQADNPALVTRYIAVDEKLTVPKEEIDRFRVHTTPTVIVLQGDREIGRIDGLPELSMDQDLAAIVARGR
jgi:thiol-disulfide isomerase/thioredoxin